MKFEKKEWNIPDKNWEEAVATWWGMDEEASDWDDVDGGVWGGDVTFREVWEDSKASNYWHWACVIGMCGSPSTKGWLAACVLTRDL